MKIAVSAAGSNLEAKVGHRFGTSQYLLVIDLESNDYEPVSNPGASGQRGSGMQAVVLAISKDVRAVLTGYCSPTAEKYLLRNGIQVVTGVSGTIRQVVKDYQKGVYQSHMKRDDAPETGGVKIDKDMLVHAFRSSINQFIGLLPILIGIILLIGLFNAFVSKSIISSIFTGDMALDTLFGACAGSILTGNPINSYIIGGGLLDYGVSLYAVTAFIVAWVAVGVIQLPAEISALGVRFAIARNMTSFALSIAIALMTVHILDRIAG